MRIIILDGHAMNPGDLSWDGLRDLGEVVEHPRTPPAEVAARMAGAEVAITNKVVFDRELLAELPELRYIGVTATGYNVVDCEAAAERGVAVTNVPTYATESVAEHVMALLLELAHGVGVHAAAVRAGRWSAAPDFCFWDRPLVELSGLTLGLVGLGRIGSAVARRALAFGMRVLATVPTPRESPVAGVELVPLDELLSRADAVSLHCPLTAETMGLIDGPRLAAMRPGAWLINTGRGPLIDAAAVAAALHDGRLGGFAADVLDREPPPADDPLPSAPNTVITPHHAWATRAARERLLDCVVANLAAFLRGEERNRVA